jgi:hypothetical protein
MRFLMFCRNGLNRLAKAMLSAIVICCYAPPAMCQDLAKATLLVITDMDCDWKFDGVSQGRLKADDAKTVSVSPGKHLVQAISVDGKDNWRTIIGISGEGQEIVEIKLKDLQRQRLQNEQLELDEEKRKKEKEAQAKEDAKPTWTDPDTSLMWMKRDNGSDVNWKPASQYCANLGKTRYQEYSDWRLPTIEELARIYDPSVEFNGKHVKGRLQLSGSQWSSTLNGSGAAWTFNFSNGRRGSDLLGSSREGRALCVRRSVE